MKANQKKAFALALEAKSMFILDLFRIAVKAKLDEWNATRAIEVALGVELSLADTIDYFASSVDTHEGVENLKNEDILKAIRKSVE